ncbi:MAG: Acyl-CoA dehydrogenase fadE12, partial [Pseudonocardiales bacterium]|nr:Acyl-CoA dehydrogenase fadE12 [Pseudonocardiales bacterium]
MNREQLFSLAPYLDEVRLLVQESFADFFEREVPSSRVRAADATHGVDHELWRAFVNLGGPQVSLPEDLGGGGGTLLDAVLIGVECGRALAPIPFAESVSASRLLALAGSHGSDFGSMRAVIDGPSGAVSSALVLGGAAAS